MENNKDLCTTSFFYVASDDKIKVRPEFLKIPEVKAIGKIEDAEKVYAFINLYVNPAYYVQYDKKRRTDIIKNEVKLDFDWKITKPVQVVIDKFLDASISVSSASLIALERTLIDSISMLNKVREKITERGDALESFDPTSLDIETGINIADTLTKLKEDFKYVIDLSKSIVGLTATYNDLKKKSLGDKKEEAPRDIMSETFDN